MPNGALPNSNLAAIPGGRLRKDAAAAWNAMRAHIGRITGVWIMPAGPRSSYRLLAIQWYFWNLYRAGLGNLAARPGTSNHGWGIAVDVKTMLMARLINKYGAPYGWQKRWSDACVPLDTRIFTRRGWLTWDELKEGDETIGYNKETQKGEWTLITAVNRQRGELFVHQHSNLSFTATKNHRWLTPGRGHGPAKLKTIDEIFASDPQSRILLAAPAEGGAGLPITTEEAALLGWALTDGSIYRFENSRGTRAYARVYQKKTAGVAAVENLMDHFDHKRFENWTGESSHSGGCTAWYVGRNVFSPILERSRLDELGPVGCVAQMSVAQRQAFLMAAQMAEGYTGTGFRQIAQSKPEVRQAIATAAALEGHLVTLRPKTVNLVRPRVQANSLTISSIGESETWCPTTESGSWLAEQDGQIFLTGNSNEWWHFKYRPGIYKPKPIYYPVIRKGSHGKSVQRLQVYLRRAGYLPAKWHVHRSYTLYVRRAVRRFQKDKKMHVDGIVGERTWRALRAAAKK